MCWYSAEHMNVLQAEAGQRLVTRRMHGSTNWMVRECDAAAKKLPAPVCLLDGTDVLLRPTENEQAALNVSDEPRAVFRMLTDPKRDVLVLPDGRELAINSLPAGLALDILVVPGSEKLSAVLETKHEAADEPRAASEPVLTRLRRLF